MHPYVVERMIEERQQEVGRMRRATGTWIPAWRQRAGRALVALGVVVAVPPARRRTATRQAASVLGLEPPC